MYNKYGWCLAFRFFPCEVATVSENLGGSLYLIPPRASQPVQKFLKMDDFHVFLLINDWCLFSIGILKFPTKYSRVHSKLKWRMRHRLSESIYFYHWSSPGSWLTCKICICLVLSSYTPTILPSHAFRHHRINLLRMIISHGLHMSNWSQAPFTSICFPPRICLPSSFGDRLVQ